MVVQVHFCHVCAHGSLYTAVGDAISVVLLSEDALRSAADKVWFLLNLAVATTLELRSQSVAFKRSYLEVDPAELDDVSDPQ